MLLNSFPGLARMAKYKGQDVDLTPTSAMAAEAERALAWRKEGHKGGTAVGVARAVQLKNKTELSPSTVKRMHSFFSRHEVDKQAEGFSPGEKGYPSPGRVAWAMWGGDAGQRWARGKVGTFANIDESAKKKADFAKGDYVSWNSSGGRSQGRIDRVETNGTIDIPDSNFSVTGTADDPAALITVWQQGAEGWAATDRKVGHKFSALTKITALKADTQTLYVSRSVTNPDDIITWAKEQGFEKTLQADDLHVTVAFSRDKVDWAAMGDSFDALKFEGGKREVTPLGDKGAVVLKFEAVELQDRWQEFRDKGASWDYPSYQPHVSITYDGGDVDLSGVTPYEGPIHLGPEKFAELDEDWSDKVTEKFDGGEAVSRQVTIKRIDEEKRVVYGEVYAPYVLDTYGEFMTPDDIELMAHRFLRLDLSTVIDTQHDNVPNGSFPVESFVAREGDPIYTPGAWVLGVKVPDDGVWQAVKSGVLNGFSFQSLVRPRDVEVVYSVVRDHMGETEPVDDGHQHVYFVQVDEMGKVIGGRTNEVDGHSHEIRRASVTDVAAAHSHRFFL